ncbi:MAG: nucleotidyltransferase domain-containing protein [Phycisphaerae bacterium]|nr:nucleotidyltransferase domain-containing protein [Phycisphaerae bacterium]
MEQRDETMEGLLSSLTERAKELDCIYTIEDILADSNESLGRVFEVVIATIPTGWQYSGACQARIRYGDQTYETEGYVDSPWAMTAAIESMGERVGVLEVSYRELTPFEDEGPFLKEERKLIDTIAERLGSCVTQRRLLGEMAEWRSAQQKLSGPSTYEWSVILSLLERTDQSLLMRVTRKMINHLCWAGVKEAGVLLRHFGVASRADQDSLLLEANRPRRAGTLATLDELVSETFRVAAAHLSDGEIVSCIHKWIKQDRAAFLINSLENYHTALSEVGDAIARYQHATHGEVELSTSTMKGVRVSLVRRFLSDQLEYINVARNYVDIKDFHDLMQRMIFPAKGHGTIGGKGAGLFLAGQILRRHWTETEQYGALKTPKTWYITSDGMHNFVYCNHLEDVFSQKYKDVDQVRQEYSDIVQVFKHSEFSADIIKGLSLALDDFGRRPLIVRSSSLLEDRFGAAFSGKYKSLFLANQGKKQQRMHELLDAIAEIYSSTFAPDPIEYRAERNLLDFQEGMGIMIQEVVGTRVGKYFLPAFAGVAFSYNEYRWSPRIKREDGLIRLVPGMGTRAVDRLGDDYPILVSPGQPGLRANSTPEETVRYAPRYVDVINLETHGFETVPVEDFLRECGAEWPRAEQIVSQFDHGRLRQPMLGQVDFERDDLVVTFEGLLTRTPFLKQMHALLNLLQEEIRSPVDIEFASDGKDIYLLQCRAQTPGKHCRPTAIPRDVPAERVLFTANRYVSNAVVPEITHIVYVDPDAYGRLGSLDDLAAVGRAVGLLNKLLPKRQFILIGPGRWGSRGDIKLGVRVTYSAINNTAMLIEVARKKGDYTPDLSFGTHFFQDLVESSIWYLPLYPDEEDVVFNEAFLLNSANILANLAPDYAYLEDTIRVIDVPNSTGGQVLRILMNAELDQALGCFTTPSTPAAPYENGERPVEAPSGQDWRWRLRMAERIAARLDPAEYGVHGLFVFGSTKNATAGPASDIDLLVHFRGTPQQREALERWFRGWSLCLSELNYLRSGYKTDGLLDVHIVTDEDIANRTSYAAKIGAVTDAARPLSLGKDVS